MSLTNAKFAARLSRLSLVASEWCADTLHPLSERLNEPMPREPVERFIKEMRERLTWLEQELNERSTQCPVVRVNTGIPETRGNP